MDHKLSLMLVLSLIAMPSILNAKPSSLTPTKQPKNNRYYICYKNKSATKATNYSNYIQYHYHGCLVSRMPCEYKSGLNNKKFGKFRTYSLALNAFYRCAYS